LGGIVAFVIFWNTSIYIGIPGAIYATKEGAKRLLKEEEAELKN
jgi:hypothetical protein